jgi:hypothetical protein
VFLWCKAYQQLGDATYLRAAERSGEAVWEQGLLKKGPGGHGLADLCQWLALACPHIDNVLEPGSGACHGISGSSYALIALYRTTGEESWLHRAVKFAEFMNRCGGGIGKEGSRGLICALYHAQLNLAAVVCSEDFAAGARTPEHPISLFEGWAAALCLITDLMVEPRLATMPMYEVGN